MKKFSVWVLFFFTPIFAFSQFNNCCFSPWEYAKIITIDNTCCANNYSNYQILLIIDTQTPISQGKMNLDGSDIRFYDQNCNQLSYWIEGGINTPNTRIWVRIPSISANSTTYILMIYGNPNATPVSNFAAVFPNTLIISNNVTLTGTQSFDWIEIKPGATVTLSAGAPLILRARKILINGTINGDGRGFNAGAGPGAGGNGGGSIGGGGGGYGGQGGHGGGGGGNQGPTYGTACGFDINMGSGGGGSDCPPTAPGGGALMLDSAEWIEVNGIISMNGGSAPYCCCGNTSEAAGGGSGGGIYIYGRYVAGNGTLRANGGNGGGSDDKEGGGGGGGGRIKLFWGTNNSFTGSTQVNGGSPGAPSPQCCPQPGQAGTVCVQQYITFTISLSPEYNLLAAKINNFSNVSCNGSADGWAKVTVIGGVPPYSYQWNPIPSTSDSIGGLSGGTYIVTVTDNVGCSDTAVVSIYEPSPITASFIIDTVSCAGYNDGQITVNPSGGNPPYNYIWSTFPPQSSQIATGLAAGTYYITITDQKNCDIILSVSMPSPTPLSVTGITITSVSCFGYTNGAVSVNASGGTQPYLYLWSNGSQGNYITGLSSGNYTVSIYDNNSCLIETSIFIPQPNQLIANVTKKDVQCAGANNGEAAIIPSGGTPPYSYNWNTIPPSSDSLVTGLSPGTYQFTLSDINNCTYTDNVTISEPPLLVVNVSNKIDVKCFGDSTGYAELSYNGGTPPYSFMWSTTPPQTTYYATGLPAGTYYASVIDANQCVTTISVQINQPPPIVINLIGSTQPSCWYSCDGVIQINPSGGTPPYTYLWSNGQTNPIATGLCGNTTYNLIVSDANNCTKNVTYSLPNPPPLQVTLYSDTTICIGTSATLTAQTQGGTQPYTYLWSNNTMGQTITVSPPANSCYTVTILDANSCSLTKSACVTLYPPISVTILPNQLTICSEQVITLQAIASGGKGAPYSFSWSTNHTSQSITYIPPYTYPQPYNIYVTASDGCSPLAKDTATISFYPEPSANFSSNTTKGCEPLPVILYNSSSSPNGYTSCIWTINQNTYYSCDSLPITLNTWGNYNVSLIIIDTNNCNDTITVNNFFTVYPLPHPNFIYNPNPTSTINTTLHFYDITYSIDPIIDYSWYFYNINGELLDTSNIQNPIYTFPPQHGTFPVKLKTTTNHYCSLDTTIFIEIQPELFIYIPNAFTPNEDNVNDFFKPEILGLDTQNFTMMIFDRWGNLIYTTQDINKPWDGSIYNGPSKKSPAPDGIYQYVIKITDLKDKNTYKLRGHITLIR